MRMRDAQKLMEQHGGFLVHFERRAGGMLEGDYFPAHDESPIVGVEKAWKLAAQWALVDPEKFVNIYVVSAVDFVPVEGYQLRALNLYPPRVKSPS